MRYPGSKKRLAPWLVENIVPRAGGRTTLIEPFLGGANSFAALAPYFKRQFALELNLDIALMWQAVIAGWAPPTEVTEAEYTALHKAPPSPLRGFVGSGCSFGGKWFGGYARGGTNADGSPRNHQAESQRAVLARASQFPAAVVAWGSYERAPVTPNCVVYCDPPYAGTLQYAGAPAAFDSERFWEQAQRWTNRGALVVVSEYIAPKPWQCIAERETRQSVSSTEHRKTTIERLFVCH